MAKKKFIIFLSSFIIFVGIIFYLQINNFLDFQFIASLSGLRESYNQTVYHAFFHSLIIYPDLAYSKKDSVAKIFKNYMITNTEFENILDQLYENNFVLVDINSIYKVNDNGGVERLPLDIPAGKKPLVLSFDDLNYYETMKGRGIADKLVIDENNETATQVTTPDGKVITTHDGDAVPILEDFIKRHPDFSVNGAKGIIAETGYDGVFGYRTNGLDLSVPNSEVDSAKKIAEKLKEDGWRFACHSYSHRSDFSDGSVPLDYVKSDTEKWEKEVEPFVGKTNLYVGPFGQIFKEGDDRRNYLMSQGFNYFFGVGARPYLRFYKDHIIMDRIDIDSYRLENTPRLLEPYFDPSKIIIAVDNIKK